MSELYIILEDEKIVSYDNLEKIVENYENLSQFVVDDLRVFCLSYKGKKKEQVEWEIGDVPLKDIAKAFLGSVE